MSYPLIIKDDFFEDPDSIVKISKEYSYNIDTHNYPGVRTKSLDEINPKLYVHILRKIFLLLHDKLPLRFDVKVGFQKFKPFVEGDKWDKKNCGWIHKDNCLFGGIIYLHKDPDKDALPVAPVPTESSIIKSGGFITSYSLPGATTSISCNLP